MKQIMYFALLLVITIAACENSETIIPDTDPETITSDTEDTETTASDCKLEPDNSEYNAYLNDAKQLVLQRILDEQLPEKDDIALPQTDVDRVLEALAAVYNAADDLDAAYEVVNSHTIHAFPSHTLNALLIGIDSSYAWAQEWIAGNALTGNPDIDNLINTYNMTLTNVGIFGSWATLQSADALNTVALSNAFATIDGVTYAQPDGFAGDGNDIEMLAYDTEITLQYSIGWGDCESGCILRHYWDFKINKDCEVEFLGSSGDPL